MVPARRDPSAYGAVVVTAAALVLVTAPVQDSWGNRSEESAVPAVVEVGTALTTGAVTGRLPVPARRRVVGEVGRVVDRWIDAAYVDVAYPRTRFGRTSLPGFTPRVARTARGDRTLLTNADIGGRIDSLEVERRDVRVDLLAVGGTARAATARVRLVFTTRALGDGSRAQRVTVRGRLFLTRESGRWRVFGYDVAKGRA